MAKRALCAHCSRPIVKLQAPSGMKWFHDDTIWDHDHSPYPAADRELTEEDWKRIERERAWEYSHIHDGRRSAEGCPWCADFDKQEFLRHLYGDDPARISERL